VIVSYGNAHRQSKETQITEMAAFLVVVLYSFVKVYELVRGICCLIALMMEAASTSETSLNFHQTTRRNNQEGSILHTRCRENLKSHQRKIFLPRYRHRAVYLRPPTFAFTCTALSCHTTLHYTTLTARLTRGLEVFTLTKHLKLSSSSS
jgi:hypothetical protein